MNVSADARPRRAPRSLSLKRATLIAQVTLMGSGAMLLGVGILIWLGHAYQLVPVHEVAGIVLVLSLWAIAAIAARSGVPRGVEVIAVIWSIVAVVFGTVHGLLVVGDWHWTMQVLHLVVALGVIGWGRVLVALMRRNEVL